MVRRERAGPRRTSLRGTYRVFLRTLLLTVLAKGGAWLPGYSIDDYSLATDGPAPGLVLSQGRLAQSFLLRLFDLLQVDVRYARVFWVAIALAVSSLLAALIARYWGLRPSGWLTLAAASFISIHPFTTEIFTFRTAVGVNACAYLLLALLLVPRRWPPALLAAGSVAFAFALSTYQAVLQYSLMILLLGSAIGLTRVLLAGNASGWARRVTALLSWRRYTRDKQAGLAACTLLGTGLYTLTNYILARTLHIGMVNHQLLSPGKIAERAETALKVLRYRFWASSPLLNPFTKRMLLLLLAFALAGLLVRGRFWRQRRSAWLTLIVLLLLAVSLVWTLGVELVLRGFWPVARVMAHVGVFWAGVLVIAHLCSTPRARRALGFLGILIALAFVGGSNHILADQLRLNIRDITKASRIVARLEVQPGFTGKEALAVEGVDWSYPLGYSTSDNDLNISAFGPPWSKAAILREISGYDLNLKLNPAQVEVAAVYCRGVGSWPGPKSVTIEDGLAIVCLREER